MEMYELSKDHLVPNYDCCGRVVVGKHILEEAPGDDAPGEETPGEEAPHWSHSSPSHGWTQYAVVYVFYFKI